MSYGMLCYPLLGLCLFLSIEQVRRVWPYHECDPEGLVGYGFLRDVFLIKLSTVRFVRFPQADSISLRGAQETKSNQTYSDTLVGLTLDPAGLSLHTTEKNRRQDCPGEE